MTIMLLFEPYLGWAQALASPPDSNSPSFFFIHTGPLPGPRPCEIIFLIHPPFLHLLLAPPHSRKSDLGSGQVGLGRASDPIRKMTAGLAGLGPVGSGPPDHAGKVTPGRVGSGRG